MDSLESDSTITDRMKAASGGIILRRINLHRRRSVRSEECSKLGIYQRQIGGYAKPYRPDRNRLHCTCPLLQSSRIRPDTPSFTNFDPFCFPADLAIPFFVATFAPLKAPEASDPIAQAHKLPCPA